MPWPTEIPSDATFYKSYFGERFALVDPDGLGELNYYSPDGVFFHQLNQTGYGNSGFSFEDPASNKKGKVKITPSCLIMTIEGQEDEPEFYPEPRPVTIKVIPLPVIRVPLHFFRLRNGKFLYVSRDKYDLKQQIHCYFGTTLNMKKVPIDVNGLGYDYTIEGFGSLRISGDKAKLGGYILEFIDPTRYLFIETEDAAIANLRHR